MTKKVLQINTVINTGSTGRIAEEIGIKAMDNGWDSYIAYGRNDRPSRSHKIKIGTALDVKWHGVATRFFDYHAQASKVATERFIKKAKEINPDIVHLHNLHGYYLNIQLLFDYLTTSNIPVVWTLHDCWPFTGHCAYFDFVQCEKWKTQCKKCPQISSYPKSFIDRSEHNFNLKKKLFLSCPNNLILVPVSEWLSHLIKDSFFKETKQIIIHNGIDTNIFTPQKKNNNHFYKLRNKFVILGVAGVWEKRKGLDDFFKLSALLDEDEIILLIGLSESQIKQLPKNIIGMTRTENVQQLAELYSLADIFVNPTWEDNFPTTNLEALSCGTPIITYNTGGSPEAVTRDTGFTVKKGNLKGIRNALDRVKKLGKQYYSAACRNRAVSLFNKNICYEQYLQLYEKLLKM